jgi:hypothetical protein
LAEADPSNAGWQRDLSFALTPLAGLYERMNDYELSLPCAEESLTIDERLPPRDRSNATWQKNVTISRALVDRLRGQQ